MNNKKLKIAPIIKIIIIFMLCSFIFGVLLALKINVTETVAKSNSSFIEIMFFTFMMNFWYILLIWHFGKTKGVFLLCYFLVFLKCFFLGITFLVNLKALHILSFLKYFITDLVILFPLYIVMLYDVSLYNFYEQKQYSSIKQIIVYLIFVLVYSLLCSIIGSTIWTI